MKRPAIQLYFGDLTKNPKVKRCGWAARGALVWTMALLHDSDEYGLVRWPLIEIARAIGAQVSLLRELVDKGALKGDDKAVAEYRWAPSHGGRRGSEIVIIAAQPGPLWYSSRMVRDEYKRINCGSTTRFKPLELTVGELSTGPPNAHQGRHHPDGVVTDVVTKNGSPSRRRGDGASSSSSSSTIGFTDSAAPARARGPENSTAGNINCLEIQKRPSDYRRNPESAASYANAVGVGTRPGESLAELVARIDQHDAIGHRP